MPWSPPRSRGSRRGSGHTTWYEVITKGRFCGRPFGPCPTLRWVSTEDDRSQGYYTTGDSSATTQSFGTPSNSSLFDDDGKFSNDQTTTFGGVVGGVGGVGGGTTDEAPRSRKPEWHRGLDLG